MPVEVSSGVEARREGACMHAAGPKKATKCVSSTAVSSAVAGGGRRAAVSTDAAAICGLGLSRSRIVWRGAGIDGRWWCARAAG